MLYGLYQSATGADLQSLRQDVISNNIANANTSSFKRDLAIFAVRPQQAELDGDLDDVPPPLQGHPGAAVVAETVTDFAQGPLQETGAAFDIALLGKGFFRVSNGQEELLSRSGSLTLNENSELVQTDTGLPVLDDKGDPIVVPPNTDINFGENGLVTAVDRVTGQPFVLGRIDLVHPNNPRGLEKVGDSLYRAAEGVVTAGPELRVRQGYLEQSGVRPITEMLAMIESSRAFEANMNLIQNQDNTLGQLLQAVGGR